jgi:hypothetical protein
LHDANRNVDRFSSLVDLSEFQLFDTELNSPLDYSRTNKLMCAHLQWRQRSNRVHRLQRGKGQLKCKRTLFSLCSEYSILFFSVQRTFVMWTNIVFLVSLKKVATLVFYPKMVVFVKNITSGDGYVYKRRNTSWNSVVGHVCPDRPIGTWTTEWPYMSALQLLAGALSVLIGRFDIHRLPRRPVGFRATDRDPIGSWASDKLLYVKFLYNSFYICN